MKQKSMALREMDTELEIAHQYIIQQLQAEICSERPDWREIGRLEKQSFWLGNFIKEFKSNQKNQLQPNQRK